MRLQGVALLATAALCLGSPLDAQQGGGPPAGEGRSNTALIVSGAVLGVTYVNTIVGDIVNQGMDFPELFVPVAGPFIALAVYDDRVSPDYTGRDLDRALLAASGVIQTAAAIVVVASLARGKGPRHAEKVPVVAVGPARGGGWAASCRIRF